MNEKWTGYGELVSVRRTYMLIVFSNIDINISLHLKISQILGFPTYNLRFKQGENNIF